jgi:FkbM family methyltransferase
MVRNTIRQLLNGVKNKLMIIDNFVNHILTHNKNYSPNVILDIGSRDLGQSIELSSVFPNAKIYAFEPNPTQFQICYDLSINYPNIKVFQLAVSDVSTEIDFYITHGNVGASSTLEPTDVPFGTSRDFTKIIVKSTRLDDWMKENKIETVDTIWMDAQGVELSALKSMGDTLKGVKYIHCEAAEIAYYKGHQLKAELDSYLVSMGFDLLFKNEAYHPYNEGDVIATNRNI